MKRKPISWECWEVLVIGLPNRYKCRKCHRVFNCIHPPTHCRCLLCTKLGVYGMLDLRRVVRALKERTT